MSCRLRLIDYRLPPNGLVSALPLPLRPALVFNSMAEYAFDPPSILEDCTKGVSDFQFFQSNDTVVAPHPDEFESDLDSALGGFDPQLSIVSNDYAPLLSIGGSLFETTVSASYDSLSSHSASYGNYCASDYSSTNYSFPFGMDSQRYAWSEYGVTTRCEGLGRISSSDYTPLPRRGPMSSDRYSYSQYVFGTTTIPPSVVPPPHTQHIVPSMPAVHPLPSECKSEQRLRKHKCPECPYGRSYLYLYSICLG